jgi:site-specific recombinase XerD
MSAWRGVVDDLRDAVSFHQLVLSANGASVHTQKQYLLYGRLFLEFLARRKVSPALTELNLSRVREFLVWYRARPHPRRTRGGEVAVRAAADILKRLGSVLEENEFFEVNPLRKLGRPKITRFTRTPFSPQEINALWGACFRTQHPARDEALFLLLLDTGMRIGEACSLRLDRLDLDARTATVMGKGRRERTVPIGDGQKRDGGRVVRALRRHLSIQAERWPDAPGYVFLARDGRRLTAAGGNDIIKRVAALAGVNDAYPHRLRHAQPLHAPVLTPNGWRTMGDLVVGDEVIGVDGKPTLVVGVYPQGMHEIVRLRFSDGAGAESTLDHLWTVRPSLSHCWPREADHWRTMPTRELMRGKGPWHTPVCPPVEFRSRDTLPIDPYTLGALLGDGHIGRTVVVLASDVDEREIIGRISAALPLGLMVSGQPGHYTLVASRQSGKPTGYTPSSVPRGVRRPELNTGEIVNSYIEGQTTVAIASRLTTTPRTITKRLRQAGVSLRKAGQPSNPLFSALTDLGLMDARSATKAIPSCYLTASVDARRELLRGLMDTDGYVNKIGAATFTTISSELARGVVELVRSLGGIATLTVRLPYVTARHPAYRIGIRTPFTPFHMTRKCERYALANGAARTRKPDRASRYELVRTVKSIEPAGVAECVCIQVANEDGLYVTQDYVVTHNTYCSWYLTSYPGDELGLRRIVGHLSRNVLADYVHFADSTIAERAGRASLAETWLGDRPLAEAGSIMNQKVRSRRMALASDDERPDPASPVTRGLESGRLPSSRNASRHLTS